MPLQRKGGRNINVDCFPDRVFYTTYFKRTICVHIGLSDGLVSVRKVSFPSSKWKIKIKKGTVSPFMGPYPRVNITVFLLVLNTSYVV